MSTGGRDRDGRLFPCGPSLLWLTLVAALGCGGSGAVPNTIQGYLDAVQQQDLERLYCLLAGASQASELGDEPAERRAGFESWALAQYDDYTSSRDEGWVDLDEQGLKLVKLFALGKGTFFSHERTRRVAPDVRVVRSRVVFGYGQIDLSSFTVGTTFYVCGTPIGRVYPIRVPHGSDEVAVEALESVAIEWTLVRAPPAGGCPGGWTVASVAPVEGSETTREIAWVF